LGREAEAAAGKFCGEKYFKLTINARSPLCINSAANIDPRGSRNPEKKKRTRTQARARARASEKSDELEQLSSAAEEIHFRAVRRIRVFETGR